MPIYEYVCDTCGLHFEQRRAFNAVDEPPCPNGHTTVHRLFRAPAVVFKGSGWYVTDSRPKESASKGES